MRKDSGIVYILVLVVLFFASNSFAVDFGFYVDLGSGSGEAEYDIAYSESFDIDSDFFGVGFQFETNPLTVKQVFSYRFQAGFESKNIEAEGGANLELGGLVINNTFAFGGNVSGKTRLWGGPQVLIGYHTGDTDEEYLGDNMTFTGFSFGLGVAGGANFGLGSGNTILTTTIGVRALGSSGDMEWYDESERMNSSTTEFYLSVGMLF